jgi:hypothetical protein
MNKDHIKHGPLYDAKQQWKRGPLRLTMAQFEQKHLNVSGVVLVNHQLQSSFLETAKCLQHASKHRVQRTKW